MIFLGNTSISNGAVLNLLPASGILINGSLFVSSSTLSVSQSGSLTVQGDLKLSSGSTLLITPNPNPNVSPLHVTGCLELNGDLTIRLPPTEPSSETNRTVSIPLADASCVTGKFTKITFETADPSCETASGGQTSTSGTVLIVTFNLQQTCNAESASHLIFSFN